MPNAAPAAAFKLPNSVQFDRVDVNALDVKSTLALGDDISFENVRLMGPQVVGGSIAGSSISRPYAADLLGTNLEVDKLVAPEGFTLATKANLAYPEVQVTTKKATIVRTSLDVRPHLGQPAFGVTKDTTVVSNDFSANGHLAVPRSGNVVVSGVDLAVQRRIALPGPGTDPGEQRINVGDKFTVDASGNTHVWDLNVDGAMHTISHRSGTIETHGGILVENVTTTIDQEGQKTVGQGPTHVIKVVDIEEDLRDGGETTRTPVFEVDNHANVVSQGGAQFRVTRLAADDGTATVWDDSGTYRNFSIVDKLVADGSPTETTLLDFGADAALQLHTPLRANEDMACTGTVSATAGIVVNGGDFEATSDAVGIAVPTKVFADVEIGTNAKIKLSHASGDVTCTRVVPGTTTPVVERFANDEGAARFSTTKNAGVVFWQVNSLTWVHAVTVQLVPVGASISVPTISLHFELQDFRYSETSGHTSELHLVNAGDSRDVSWCAGLDNWLPQDHPPLLGLYARKLKADVQYSITATFQNFGGQTVYTSPPALESYLSGKTSVKPLKPGFAVENVGLISFVAKVSGFFDDVVDSADLRHQVQVVPVNENFPAFAEGNYTEFRVPAPPAGSTGNSELVVAGLQHATDYKARVRTSNAKGDSALTEGAHFTTANSEALPSAIAGVGYDGFEVSDNLQAVGATAVRVLAGTVLSTSTRAYFASGSSMSLKFVFYGHTNTFEAGYADQNRTQRETTTRTDLYAATGDAANVNQWDINDTGTATWNAETAYTGPNEGVVSARVTRGGRGWRAIRTSTGVEPGFSGKNFKNVAEWDENALATNPVDFYAKQTSGGKEQKITLAKYTLDTLVELGRLTRSAVVTHKICGTEYLKRVDYTFSASNLVQTIDGEQIVIGNPSVFDRIGAFEATQPAIGAYQNIAYQEDSTGKKVSFSFRSPTANASNTAIAVPTQVVLTYDDWNGTRKTAELVDTAINPDDGTYVTAVQLSLPYDNVSDITSPTNNLRRNADRTAWDDAVALGDDDVRLFNGEYGTHGADTGGFQYFYARSSTGNAISLGARLVVQYDGYSANDVRIEVRQLSNDGTVQPPGDAWFAVFGVATPGAADARNDFVSTASNGSDPVYWSGASGVTGNEHSYGIWINDANTTASELFVRIGIKPSTKIKSVSIEAMNAL